MIDTLPRHCDRNWILPVKSLVLKQGSFCVPEHVWQYLEVSLVVTGAGGGGAKDIECVGAKEAAKHPTMYRTASAPITKNYLTQRVHSALVEENRYNGYNNHSWPFLILWHCTPARDCWNNTAALNHVPPHSPPLFHAVVTRRETWGRLSFLLFHWFVGVHPKPGMRALFSPSFYKHTSSLFLLPIPISLLAPHTKYSPASEETGVPWSPLWSFYKWLGKKMHSGAHEHALPSPSPPPLPSPSEWKEPRPTRDANCNCIYAGLPSSYLSHMLRQWGKNTRFLKIQFPEQKYLWAGEKNDWTL